MAYLPEVLRLSPKDYQGPFLATKNFLPKLEKGQAPRVINISSDFASISGMPNSAAFLICLKRLI